MTKEEKKQKKELKHWEEEKKLIPKMVFIYCKGHKHERGDKPDMKVKIKDVMKYSGPKLLFSHPIFSISHVVQMIKYKKSLKKTQKAKEEEKND